MNYLREIAAFYDWLETNQLPTSAIVLWHALMHVANRTGWQDNFAVAVSVLEIKTGLSRKTVYDARNKLKQASRITFEARPGSQSAVYSIIPFVCDNYTQNVTQRVTQQVTQPVTEMVTQSVTQQVTQPVTINKLNKTKPINPPSEGKRPRFVPPTVEEVAAYCRERGNRVDPQRFVDFYSSKGWLVGKAPMKDWKAAVRNWEGGNRNGNAAGTGGPQPGGNSAPSAGKKLDFSKPRTDIPVPEVQR